MTARVPAHAVEGLPAGSVGDLTDVDTTTTPPSVGDVMAWDGSAWVPTSDSGGAATAGPAEVLVVDGVTPPENVTNEAADDWLYQG